jgi:hypothetical protein
VREPAGVVGSGNGSGMLTPSLDGPCLDGRAPGHYPEMGTTCQSPPFRLTLLPLS